MLFNKSQGEDFQRDYSSRHHDPADEAPVAPRRHTTGSPTRSVIDSWLRITGDLHSEAEVHVDGQIKGDIRCAHLTVGKDATVIGTITADEVIVRGKVQGTIRAHRVILQDSARVDSEIFHKTLAVEEGACFDGRSWRRENPLSADVVDLQTAVAEKKISVAA